MNKLKDIKDIIFDKTGTITTGNFNVSQIKSLSNDYSDDEILEYIEQGYDIQQVSSLMQSDINLVALKVDTLISQGYRLYPQEHQNDFLKYKK